MRQETKRLDTVYQYIKERIESKDGSPSQREIAEHCHFSVTSVSRCLSMLEAQGRISRDGLKSRSIRLMKETDELEGNETAEEVYAYLVRQIGRAHGLNSVTWPSRMPSSA